MKKLSVDSSLKIYVIIYFIAMLIYASKFGYGLLGGEWSSYIFPIASIIYEFDISIGKDTAQYFKELFPEFSVYIDSGVYNFSIFTTKDGLRELVWYFPIYAIFSIPFVLILKLFSLPASLGIVYLNVVSIVALLLLTIKYIKLPNFEKIFLILLLSINPILCYANIIMGETFIYSLLGISIVFWLSKKYYSAAFAISLAGAMNPVVMVLGFAIIFSYFYDLFSKNNFKIIKSIKNNIISILKLGLCFIISIVPMLYNIYHTGYINLSRELFKRYNYQQDTVSARFIAYFTDMNFGFLPYYNLFFMLAFVMFVLAILKKHIKFLELALIFLIIVFMYSLVWHINCLMFGISRYNAWSAVLIIFMVLYYLKDFFTNIILKIVRAILLIFMFINFYFVFSNITYPVLPGYFLPFVEKILIHTPEIYNPLPSTFNARVNHIDGGYDYKTPIVFKDKNGYVRKILASKKDIEALNVSYIAIDEKSKQKWQNEINTLGEKESYLNFRKKYKIIEKK